MCGGIGFRFEVVDEGELLRFLDPQKVREFKRTGEVQIFFWSKRPILPVEISSAVHLYDWGNREKDIELPKTGWARIESLYSGAWNHLGPKEVLIPAARGFEKKVWFKIAKGILGVMVEKNGIYRVYMVTEPANSEYVKLTGHERMPKFV